MGTKVPYPPYIHNVMANVIKPRVQNLKTLVVFDSPLSQNSNVLLVNKPTYILH